MSFIWGDKTSVQNQEQYRSVPSVESDKSKTTNYSQDEIQVAIKWLETKAWEIMPMDKRHIAIDALRAYKPEPCEFVSDLLGGFNCSRCKKHLDGDESYCPNCGAKLQEKQLCPPTGDK